MFVKILWRKLPKLLQKMSRFWDTHSKHKVENMKYYYSLELLYITFKQPGNAVLSLRHNRCKHSL